MLRELRIIRKDRYHYWFVMSRLLKIKGAYINDGKIWVGSFKESFRDLKTIKKLELHEILRKYHNISMEYNTITEFRNIILFKSQGKIILLPFNFYHRARICRAS
jgi:hypothetical protein